MDGRRTETDEGRGGPPSRPLNRNTTREEEAFAQRSRVHALIALCAALAGCATTIPGESLVPYEPPRYAYSAAFGGAYHVVEKGQTLWRIARAYGVDLEKLQWINDIDDVAHLAAGRRIFIPGARRALKVEPFRPGEAALPVARLTEPLAWPLDAGPTSGFGPREGEPHRGIDLPALEGKPIEAAAGGKVVYSGQGMRGYGNVVVIKHNEDISTVYAHNAINLVKEGATVEQGEVIAEVGRTGRATGPHLHFEVRVRGAPQDPMKYLPPARGN